MRRTKAEAAETRATILAAAETMFFEKGVANTSLDEVAAAAGVTRGAVYWHFESKTAIFLELYNTVRLPRLTMLDLDNAEQSGDVLSMIERLALEWLQLLSHDPQRQRMLTILLRTNFTQGIDQVSEAVRSQEIEEFATLVELFRRAERIGTLAPPWTPETASNSLKWMMKGMCWEWLLEEDKFDLQSQGGDCVRHLLASFRQDA